MLRIYKNQQYDGLPKAYVWGGLGFNVSGSGSEGFHHRAPRLIGTEDTQKPLGGGGGGTHIVP